MTQSEQSQANPAGEKANRSKLKTIMMLGPSLIFLFIFGFVLTGSVYLRHVPLTVEATDKCPPFKQTSQKGLVLRYLGVTGYEISDGKTTIITDPMVNRPTALEIISGKLNPDPALAKKWVPKADYILVNHAHYDHSLDAPNIALRTGAIVIGSQSTVNLALSKGVPKKQTMLVKGGEVLTLGTFTVRVVKARHGPVLKQNKPMAGIIDPTAKAMWFFQYTMNSPVSYHLEANGSTVWFHPSTLMLKDELAGFKADTLIMGVNGMPVTGESAKMVVDQAQPKRIIPTHYDNFFQPISKGLSLMPDLDMNRAKTLLTGHSKEVKWFVLDYNEKLYLPPDAEN
jgi:L-ascorbate metabolism protein UlaG (beta-lactamase superfamily)